MRRWDHLCQHWSPATDWDRWRWPLGSDGLENSYRVNLENFSLEFSFPAMLFCLLDPFVPCVLLLHGFHSSLASCFSIVLFLSLVLLVSSPSCLSTFRLLFNSRIRVYVYHLLSISKGFTLELVSCCGFLEGSRSSVLIQFDSRSDSGSSLDVCCTFGARLIQGSGETISGFWNWRYFEIVNLDFQIMEL